jgi:leucyl aminopeptidase
MSNATQDSKFDSKSFLSKLEVKTSTVPADAELLFVAQDSGKKPIPPKGPFGAVVEKMRKAERFQAKLGTTSFVPFIGKGDSQALLAVGLGGSGEIPLEKFRHAGAFAFAKAQSEKLSSIQIHTSSLHEVKGLKDPAKSLEAFLQGFFMSMYKFDKYKKERSSDRVSPEKIILLGEKADKGQLEALAADILVMAEAVNIARDWSNEPSNYGTPEFFAKEAQKKAKELGLKCTILSEKDAAREGMGLFLAVGQGSEREGKIVVLDYNPKGAKKTIALVGKGVTFDSGGISIKPSLRMEEMKHDMTGAASLYAATVLAAKRKVKNRIITILAFTENMPDGTAVQPGNVVKARNGLTVEINNTDAEGRLILADVLDYAHDFKPDCIINAATLTGAVVVALGKHCTGVMGSDDKLIEQLRKIGDENHERLWQLPLFDEYIDDMRTDCADLRNVGNDGNGGTIRGGIFLKQFIRKGMPWAHLDIAATAWGMGHLPYCPKKGGSGIIVRTIAQFLGDY